MVIDDLIPSAGRSCLVVTHIPVHGHGYQLVHNLDTASPGSGEIINQICNRLTSPLRARFQADKASHSLFEYTLTDNVSVSLYASRIDKASFDEMGRQGIVHGIYLQQHVDRAAWISCDMLLSRFEDCFLTIEEEHRRLRERITRRSDSSLVIAQFVGVLSEMLKAFIASPEVLGIMSPEILEIECEPQPAESSQATADVPQAPRRQLMLPERRRFTRLWKPDQRRW